MKDNDDDCDLDPELSVTDLLVDEGKAARDGSDQRVTVKIIQEQGRAVRAGSVIPDLTPAHYQPPARPPVPKFADNKRPHGDQQDESAPPKRRRLGQIEEEEREDVVDSIERDRERGFSYFELPDAHFLSALNGETYNAAVRPKIESPELPMPWTNAEPATRDELELLPEPPTNLRFRPPRPGLPTSAHRRSRDIEIRETSQVPPENGQHKPIASADKSQHPVVDGFQRHHSHSSAPITPSYTPNAFHTPAAQAVSLLNSMKSTSPAQRQSNSSSVSRFRKPGANGNDVYDYPESDIDDTQMSPRSRAMRANITPKQITPRLVQTPQVRNALDAATSAARRTSATATSDNATSISGLYDRDQPRRFYVAGDTLARQTEREVETDAMDLDTNKENENLASKDTIKPTIPDQRPLDDRRSMMDIEKSSILASDETYVQDTGGTKKKVKKPRSAKKRKKSSEALSISRSHSVASSAKESHRSGQSAKSHRSLQQEHNQTADGSPHRANTTDELDGPSEQLLQALHQSSPELKKTTEVRVDVPLRKLDLQEKIAPSKTQSHGDGHDQDIDRPPESVSEENDTIPKPKVTKRAKPTPRPLGKQLEDDRRCLTCWRKPRRCDNLQPKCTGCEKSKKNCQVFKLTKEAADEIFDQRRADKGKNARSKSKARASEEAAEHDKDETTTAEPSTQQLGKSKSKVRKSTAAPSEVLTSAGDGGEENENENEPSQEVSGPMADEKKSKAPKSKKILPASDERENATQESKPEKATSKREKKKKTTGVPSDEIVPVNDQENASKRAKESKGEKSLSSEKATAAEHAALEPAKQNLAVAAGAKFEREASTERRATSSVRIIPPDITEEQYDILIKDRNGLTEEQRRAEKLRYQKLGKQKEFLPLSRSLILDRNAKSDKQNRETKEPMVQIPRSSSSQAASDRAKERPLKVKEDVKVPSSTQGSVRDHSRKSLPATQPAQVTALAASSTPLPVKAPEPATEPQKSRMITQKRVKPMPIQISDNNNNSIKNNPPFRLQKPLSVSTSTLGILSISQPAAASTNSTTTPITSLANAKSLSGLKNLLSQNKSASSTPQPVSAAARLVAEAKKKKGFLFDVNDDDDEDEDEETESDEDEEDDGQGVKPMGISKRPVVVRPRASTAELETGSELSDDDL